jgi:hypothetical protein
MEPEIPPAFSFSPEARESFKCKGIKGFPVSFALQMGRFLDRICEIQKICPFVSDVLRRVAHFAETRDEGRPSPDVPFRSDESKGLS